ncbi:hypothetical protein Ccrd_002273 [Cynara cardunculus var. scolymus]|uniref:Myb/SANT-like domain-containing protein n=1 Tax=Cynara cardunculus var. scolymus TaxID=59895 RepID=A0A118JWH3_CYNCS|nr:hypothetical protein Ccrd_002273 [Cynara cardunculus var. scolymus]
MGRVPERGSKTKKHKWTRREDEALISALTELCQTGWKRDNNIFRSGYTTVLEKELKSKLPGCNLKASPHIESRLKTLKKHCDAITDMKDAFGIEWRGTECTLICYDDDVWDDWVKTSENAGHMSRDEQFNPIYRTNGKVLENENNESDHEEANNHKGNDMAVDDSNDDDVLVDDVVGTPMQMHGCSTSPQVTNKKAQSIGSWSTGMEALAKIFDTMLKRHEEQFSLLAGLVGREVAADKAAADKRARLNGELKRIPNLSLQARLRAASVIVSDPAKLDLFYSLSNEERKEWVSMLLSGLI